MGGIAAAAALPFLRFIPRAEAADAPPKRFAVFFSPNQVVSPSADDVGEREWRPAPGPLGDLMTPMNELDRHKPKLLMLGGFDTGYRRYNHGAITVTLTGRQPRFPMEGPNGSQAEAVATGISVDQYIADFLGDRALVLGVRPGGPNGMTRLSHRGDASPVDPYDDPVRGFEAVFGAGLGPNEELEAVRRRITQRMSVLDIAAGELGRLSSNARLGRADRLKLEQHLTDLRALEQRLADQLMDDAGCEQASPPSGAGYEAPENVVRTARTHMDIIAQTFACNVSRVCVLQVGNSGDTFGSNIQAPEYGISIGNGIDEHNDLAHGSDLALREKVETIYFRLFAEFLDKLGQVPIFV